MSCLSGYTAGHADTRAVDSADTAADVTNKESRDESDG